MKNMRHLVAILLNSTLQFKREKNLKKRRKPGFVSDLYSHLQYLRLDVVQ